MNSLWKTAFWQQIWVAIWGTALLHTCLQRIAFYLFSFSNGVSQACQPHLVLSLRFFSLSFFFVPCRFFSSQSQRRKRALTTPRPQSHLRQMKQPLFSSSLPSLAPSPPHSSSQLMMALYPAVTNPKLCNFCWCTGEGGWEGLSARLCGV